MSEPKEPQLDQELEEAAKLADYLQPERHQTAESAEEAFNVASHEANKAALRDGISPELAKSLAQEMMLLNRRDQLIAYGEGGHSVEDYQRWSQDDLHAASLLFEYADGNISPEATQLMEDRIAEINSKLDQLGESAPLDKVAEMVGTSSPIEAARFRREFLELQEVRHPLTAEDAAIDTTEPAPERVAEIKARFDTAIEALSRDEGIYTEGKGVALTIEAARELGLSDTEVQNFMDEIAVKYDQLMASADTLLSDKSPQSRQMWAENQLRESFRDNPIITRLDQRIDAHGASLAGRGGRISSDKVFSSAVAYAIKHRA